MNKMTDEEITIIKKEYDRVLPLFIKSILVYGLVPAFLTFFLPKALLSKSSGDLEFSGNGSTFFEDSGMIVIIVVFLIIIVVAFLFFNLKYDLLNLRKDLSEKRKIITLVTVASVIDFIENDETPVYYFKNGETYDSLMVLDKDGHNLGTVPFNKITSPEYLDAQELELELANYTKIILAKKILS